MDQIFLLSPARCDGERAKLLLNREAEFDLARRIRSEGAPIGEVFSFLSGLYFRGKLAYARAFGSCPGGSPAYVITADRGLVPPETVVYRRDLVAFSRVDIAAAGARHRVPLRRDVEQLAARLAPSGSNRALIFFALRAAATRSNASAARPSADDCPSDRLGVSRTIDTTMARRTARIGITRSLGRR